MPFLKRAEPVGIGGQPKVSGAIYEQYRAGANLSAGTPVCLNSAGDVVASATAELNHYVGVCVNSPKSGEVAVVQTRGVAAVRKNTGTAISRGTLVFALDGGICGTVANPSFSDVVRLVGVSAADAAAADSTVQVSLKSTA